MQLFLSALPALLGLAGFVLYQVLGANKSGDEVTRRIIDKLQRVASPELSDQRLTPKQVNRLLEQQQRLREVVGEPDLRLLKQALTQHFLLTIFVYVLALASCGWSAYLFAQSPSRTTVQTSTGENSPNITPSISIPEPQPPPPTTGSTPAPIAPIRVGADVEQAKLIKQPKPIYPSLAKSARVQGKVKLEATIGRDGTILSLKLLSGHPLLVQSAMQAVQQWVYKPTLVNGEAVEVITTIDVNFSEPNQLSGEATTPAKVKQPEPKTRYPSEIALIEKREPIGNSRTSTRTAPARRNHLRSPTRNEGCDVDLNSGKDWEALR